MKALLFLFFTGYIQIALVAFNTWQIAHQKWISAMFVSFIISVVWTFNVKSIAIGKWAERIVYSLGCALGCGSGILMAKILH